MIDDRYPIGRFQAPQHVHDEDRKEWIAELHLAPARLRNAVAGLGRLQLDTPYREGGWTVRQVVHHVADSHMNSYVRSKLVLTEERPTVKPYAEAAWAQLSDSRLPVEVSLDLLDALHARWVALLVGLPVVDWHKSFVHPESGASVTLERNLALYAWHGRHHTAHVTRLRERSSW